MAAEPPTARLARADRDEPSPLPGRLPPARTSSATRSASFLPRSPGRLAPSLQGRDWQLFVSHLAPARGAADMLVTATLCALAALSRAAEGERPHKPGAASG